MELPIENSIATALELCVIPKTFKRAYLAVNRADVKEGSGAPQKFDLSSYREPKTNVLGA